MGRFRLKPQYFVWVIIAIILAGFGFQDIGAQTSDSQYFPETGHTVRGAFLELYQSVDDPEMLYGNPITDAFEDPRTFRTVQYFEHARFELHPEEPFRQQVQRTPIGENLYKAGLGQPLPVPKNSPSCQTFQENNLQVCYAFLEFFNAHGKVPQFGYPISNYELHGDLIVQYFQLARLEWHRNEPHGQRVKVSNLGQVYFHKMREDPRLTIPNRDLTANQVVSSINARAYPRFAVLGSEAEQSIFVIVRDQKSLPVADVDVSLEILLPSGEKVQTRKWLKTNSDGIAVFHFSISSLPKGRAEVRAVAKFGSYEDRTTTSFQVWW